MVLTRNAFTSRNNAEIEANDKRHFRVECPGPGLRLDAILCEKQGKCGYF